jgi:ABC-type multidrug transport system fused ATPase/permease subunit
VDSRTTTGAAMKALLRDVLRPHRRALAIILAAMLVQMAMSLAAPWPLKVILDSVVGDHRPPQWIDWLLPMLGGATKAHIAAAAGIVTIIIALMTGAAMYSASYLTESLGQHIGNELRVRLYHRLQKLSLAYYDTTRVGTILSTLTTDVQTIQSFASSSTLGIFTKTLTLGGMVVVMVLLRWDFALIALGVTPLLALFVVRVSKAMKNAVTEVRRRQSDLLATLQEGLQSIDVVQAFGREDHQKERLYTASMATVTAWLKARRVSSLLSPVVGIAAAATTGVVLWRGSLLILTGAMTAGALTVFVSYLAKFFQPVRDLAQMTNTIAGVFVGFDRVREICDADLVIPERSAPVNPRQFRGEVGFEHVAFAYDPAVPVLRDVTFTIRPGQMVGIVGPTGSGKSTLVSLIARFRDPTAGRITIDGVDTRDYTLHGLRSQIGFVLQDTVLFRGTIRENIAFGRPDATDVQIVAAAKLANAHEFITRLPDGYETLIGDRGRTLSGGQRQRIGIARALIRDNPILILDEPTAALDVESEELVIEALERLMEGRTVITIAHRLSTLRNADKIVVIRDGVVAEHGAHEELLALDGAYAQLHRLQRRPLAAATTAVHVAGHVEHLRTSRLVQAHRGVRRDDDGPGDDNGPRPGASTRGPLAIARTRPPDGFLNP